MNSLAARLRRQLPERFLPLRAIIIEMDPDNPVVRLCVKGMECEFAGDFDGAAQAFQTAWDQSTDDFERCIAAHYVARHQKTPAGTLAWNEKSLHHASAVGED